MKNYLIINYINNLTLNDIASFALKNNINLDSKESHFILNYIKNNYNDILYDEEKTLSILKESVSSDNYLKIKELYIYYKNKYKGYLF